MHVQSVMLLQTSIFNFIRYALSAETPAWSIQTEFTLRDVEELRAHILLSIESSPDLHALINVKLKLINLRKLLARENLITPDFCGRNPESYSQLLQAFEEIHGYLTHLNKETKNPVNLSSILRNFDIGYDAFLVELKKELLLQARLAHFVTLKSIRPLAPIQHSYEGDFRNEVYLAVKTAKLAGPRDYHRWYWKKCDSSLLAAYELIGQELMRFFFPWNPKTRVGLNAEKKFGIMSKEVVGFRSFFQLSQQEFEKYNKDDLLAICAIAMSIAAEMDLRKEHVGFDKYGNMVKIDGGCIFGNINRVSCFEEAKLNVKFTADDINNLPAVINFLPYNWLNSVEKGVRYPIANQEYQANSYARMKMHYVLLQAMLLPDSFFKIFVSHYITKPSWITIMTSEFSDRRDMLVRALAQDEGIKAFIACGNYESLMSNYMLALNCFKPVGKRSLFPESSSISQLMNSRFGELRVKIVGVAPTRSLGCGTTPQVGNRYSHFKRKALVMSNKENAGVAPVQGEKRFKPR
jgi:hypothetical protein